VNQNPTAALLSSSAFPSSRRFVFRITAQNVLIVCTRVNGIFGARLESPESIGFSAVVKGKAPGREEVGAFYRRCQFPRLKAVMAKNLCASSRTESSSSWCPASPRSFVLRTVPECQGVLGMAGRAGQLKSDSVHSPAGTERLADDANGFVDLKSLNVTLSGSGRD
jgi:hypothetical protein